MTKLVLGTAQFGSGYGLTSEIDRVSDVSLREILDVAKGGIDLFDTAPDYGDAQQRLGKLKQEKTHLGCVSKFVLPPGSGLPNADNMYLKTMSDLGETNLYGLMFHRVSDLRDDRADRAWRLLRQAREDGAITRIGASIYDNDDLRIVEDRFPDVDLLQIPGNILDRRLLDSPLLQRMHDQGVEIHVRSAYLQGLLLSSPADIPDYFRELDAPLERLRAAAKSREVSVMDLALSFLKNLEIVDAVLVGATSAAELEATLRSWGQDSPHSVSFDAPPLPESLLDPRRWPPRGPRS